MKKKTIIQKSKADCAALKLLLVTMKDIPAFISFIKSKYGANNINDTTRTDPNKQLQNKISNVVVMEMNKYSKFRAIFKEKCDDGEWYNVNDIVDCIIDAVYCTQTENQATTGKYHILMPFVHALFNIKDGADCLPIYITDDTQSAENRSKLLEFLNPKREEFKTMYWLFKRIETDEFMKKHIDNFKPNYQHSFNNESYKYDVAYLNAGILFEYQENKENHDDKENDNIKMAHAHFNNHAIIYIREHEMDGSIAYDESWNKYRRLIMGGLLSRPENSNLITDYIIYQYKKLLSTRQDTHSRKHLNNLDSDFIEKFIGMLQKYDQCKNEYTIDLDIILKSCPYFSREIIEECIKIDKCWIQPCNTESHTAVKHKTFINVECVYRMFMMLKCDESMVEYHTIDTKRRTMLDYVCYLSKLYRNIINDINNYNEERKISDDDKKYIAVSKDKKNMNDDLMKKIMKLDENRNVIAYLSKRLQCFQNDIRKTFDHVRDYFNRNQCSSKKNTIINNLNKNALLIDIELCETLNQHNFEYGKHTICHQKIPGMSIIKNLDQNTEMLLDIVYMGENSTRCMTYSIFRDKMMEHVTVDTAQILSVAKCINCTKIISDDTLLVNIGSRDEYRYMTELKQEILKKLDSTDVNTNGNQHQISDTELNDESDIDDDPDLETTEDTEDSD